MLIKKTDKKNIEKMNQSFDNYREFMSDFFEIFNIVKPNLNLFEHNNISGKKLVLTLLGSDNDIKIYDYLSDKYGENKSNTDFYCLGKDGFEMFLGSGFNMLGYSNITNDVQESDLDDLWSHIYSIKSSKYEYVNICYMDKNSSQIVEFDLFPMSWLDIQYFASKFSINTSFESNSMDEICLWPGDNEISIELLFQYIQHIVYGIILEHKINYFNYGNLISLNIFNRIAAN